MHETPFSFSQLETPAPGSVLPQGKHLLRGWVWPKPGGHFVDVRARLGNRIFPGVHGFPRADLAAHFATGRAFALAEFHLVVDFGPGPAEITLETLEIEGRWSAFQTVNFQIAPASPPVDLAVPSGPLRWHEYGRALQILLRGQRRQPGLQPADLARELVDAIPYPRDLRHPHLPFRGHLDEPAAVTACSFGRTAVLGYLFHETQPIKRVLATFDLQGWQTVEQGKPSPGPAGYYPQFTNAGTSGLFGLIDVPAQLPNPVCLRLYAELADGSLHLCSVQRSRLFTSEEEKGPYPPQTSTGLAAYHAALRSAMSNRGIEVVDDEEMRRELSRIEADFKARAPKEPPRPPAGLPDTVPGTTTGAVEANKGAPLQVSPATTDAQLPRRILLVTHSLELEGAPLFLVDYARHLVSAGASLALLSPADGPLRPRFEEFGVRVMVADAAMIHAAPSAAAARQTIDNLTFNFAAYDLVVCNTFTTFWAVHGAKAAGRRVLLYLHESTPPAIFFQGRAVPEVIALVNEAIGLADCVSFTTAATRIFHLDHGRPNVHRLTPGWIEVTRLDTWRARHPRERLRERFALGANELLVTNVGTVSSRKGQHIFARAVDLLWQRHPALAARTRFVMLGGRASSFDAMLGDLLVQLGRANLVVHPETTDYLPYYAAADLFVCSSYEESSPRVILEAMTCGTPILSSAVHGVPEMVRPGLEAVLVPPGDTVALCDHMAKLLFSPEIGRTLAARARARVVSQFEAKILLPRHAALAAEVAAGRIT